MSDPFLNTHQVYPSFFNLGGRLAPISIRDQMVRAQMFNRIWMHCETVRRRFGAEVESTQTWAWAERLTGDHHDHLVYERLDGIHRRIAEGLVGRTAIQNNIQKLLANFNDRIASLKLVHSCSHLTAMYPLNRFLAILLDAYVRIVQKAQGLLLPKLKVEKVDSADTRHKCAYSPVSCHGFTHDVTVVEANSCYSARGSKAFTEQAEVVVIRHGIDATGLPPLPELSQPRQILPTAVV